MPIPFVVKFLNREKVQMLGIKNNKRVLKVGLVTSLKAGLW